MLLPRKHLILFRNNNARIVAVPANQHLDHVGHTPVFNICSLAHGFFHAGVDSEIEGGYLGSGHRFGVLRKYGKCNALCVTMPVNTEDWSCRFPIQLHFDRLLILASEPFFRCAKTITGESSYRCRNRNGSACTRGAGR